MFISELFINRNTKFKIFFTVLLQYEGRDHKINSKINLPNTVSCTGLPVTTNPSGSSASHCHLPSSSSLTLSISRFPLFSTRNRCPLTLLLLMLSFRMVCTIWPFFSQTLELKLMLTPHSSVSLACCSEYIWVGVDDVPP